MKHISVGGRSPEEWKETTLLSRNQNNAALW